MVGMVYTKKGLMQAQMGWLGMNKCRGMLEKLKRFKHGLNHFLSIVWQQNVSRDIQISSRVQNQDHEISRIA